jgi:preprotein translocase subunit SecE
MAETTMSTRTAGVDAPKEGLKERSVGFFQTVAKEMRKVTWPTKEALQEATLITIVVCVVFSLMIFGIDKIFESVLKLVYSLAG